jgi:hypothetical protein
MVSRANRRVNWYLQKMLEKDENTVSVVRASRLH